MWEIVTIISITTTKRIKRTVLLDEDDDILDLGPKSIVIPAVAGWDGHSQPGKGGEGYESTQSEANHVEALRRWYAGVPRLWNVTISYTFRVQYNGILQASSQPGPTHPGLPGAKSGFPREIHVEVRRKCMGEG